MTSACRWPSLSAAGDERTDLTLLANWPARDGCTTGDQVGSAATQRQWEAAEFLGGPAEAAFALAVSTCDAACSRSAS